MSLNAATGSIAPPVRLRAIARIGETSQVKASFSACSAMRASFRCW